MISTVRDETFFYSRLDVEFPGSTDEIPGLFNSTVPIDIVIPMTGACIQFSALNENYFYSIVGYDPTLLYERYT